MPRPPSPSRSANMARIRGNDTGPELLLRKALWHRGLRFRLNLRVEGTRPDIIFPSCRLAIFVDGCFWHGCPLHYVRPRSRSDFWDEKLRTNTARDRLQTRRLLENGWSILRIWEHDIGHDLPAVVEAVIQAHRDPSGAFGHRSVVVRVETQNEEDTTERWYIEELMGRTDGHSELRARNPRRLTP